MTTPSYRPTLVGKPAVENPPPLGELRRSLELVVDLMRDGLMSGAAWDIARARCWSHWQLPDPPVAPQG